MAINPHRYAKMRFDPQKDLAPVATPEPVLSRLRAEVNKALALSEVRERLRHAGGVEPWITTPEDFAAEIRSDHAKYARLVKEAGAKID